MSPDKIVFYTHTPRSFRTTLIYYLYEVAQVHSVVVVAHQDLDQEALRLIGEKSLFPGVEKVVSLGEGLRPNSGIISRHSHFFCLVNELIDQHKPNVAIASSDWHSLIEMQLFRRARRHAVLNVTIQDTNQSKAEDESRWINLMNVYLRTPAGLPSWIRFSIVNVRKYIGHFFYYWWLPILAGVKPFWGFSSFVLYRGASGSRESDCHVVFSERSKQYYLESGIPGKKLKVLEHPLKRGVNPNLFETLVGDPVKKEEKKIVVVLFPGIPIGFGKDYSLISTQKRMQVHVEIVSAIVDLLVGWRIQIKPHPDTKNLDQFVRNAKMGSEQFEIIDPQEPVDRYFQFADAVIELPMSNSTALFTAALQRPDIPVVSTDLHHEYRGDFYKDHQVGVEYVDSTDRLRHLLMDIASGAYKRPAENTDTLESQGASDLPGLLVELMRRKPC